MPENPKPFIIDGFERFDKTQEIDSQMPANPYSMLKRCFESAMKMSEKKKADSRKMPQLLKTLAPNRVETQYQRD